MFVTTRNDDYYGFELGASYHLSKQVTLRADYQHSNNDSNIALYQYRRDIITLRARYEFR